MELGGPLGGLLVGLEKGSYIAIDEKGCLSVVVYGMDKFNGSWLKLKAMKYMVNPGM